MDNLAHAAAGFINTYGYFGFFVALGLGNMAVPIGTEIILPLAGGLTATGHLGSLWLTIVVAVAAELTGGTAGYAIGRFGGVPIIERYGKYVHFTHDRLVLVHRFFERWGAFAIFVCRFLPVLRGIVSIPAGIAQMNLALFYVWTFLGSSIFCAGLILLGNAFGAHISTVMPLLHRWAYVALGVAVVAVVVVIAVARMRSRPVGPR